MTQSKLSQNGFSLLTHAISRLRPEVFSHPIWVRFGKKEPAVMLNITETLINTANNIQALDPRTACQVLLICAVYQNYSGQSHNAFDTIQNALTLAKRSNLFEEVLWALWGACAIRYQQGNIKQAASILEELQTDLNKRDEWVLADFIEVTKQSLLHLIVDRNVDGSEKYREQSVPDLLKLTFDWLQQWGYFAKSPKFAYISTSENPTNYPTKKINLTWQFSSLRGWQSLWQSMLRFFKSKNNRISRNDLIISQSSRSLPTNEEYAFVHSHPPISPALIKQEIPKTSERSITVVAQMLGAFSISIQDSLVKLSASRGLSLLKYLLLHNNQSTPREMLMEIFWPDLNPEAARNNLNVTIYALRKELRSATDEEIICYEDSAYHLSRKIKLWLDVEELEKCIKAGNQFEARNQTTFAVAEYEIAVNLYQGDFLADNPYDDWTVFDRERLRVTYLDTLNRLSQIYFRQERYAACINLSQLILNHDLCREDAHYRLMQCFSRLGQGPLALRQYQICVEALQAELEVDPAPDTTQLYEQIRRHEQI